MIKFSNTMLISPLLYFKCAQGHYTPCKAKSGKLVFCKSCNKIFEKKDCERFTDSMFSKKTYKKSNYEQFGAKKLYKFTASVRRNYHRYVRKRKDQDP